MKTEILKVLESVKQNKISNSEALEWLERLKKRDVPEITDSKVTGSSPVFSNELLPITTNI